MITFEFDKKEGIIRLHNTSEVPLKGDLKMKQVVVQEFGEKGAREIYKNISADTENAKQAMKNSETMIAAEQVKVNLNKKNFKHLKKMRKLLKSKIEEAGFSLEEPKENEPKSD